MKQDKLQIMGKLQPQAIDLERAVLGAIMISQYAFDKVSDIVKPNFFYNENHMKIYTSMVELASKRLPIDLMTVVEMLKQKGELENVGGAYYVSCLTNDVVSDASIEYNSRIIAQKFVGRELIKISSEVLNNAYDETVDVFSLLDKSEHSIAELRIGNIKKQYKELSDIATKNIAHLENLRHRDIDISGVSSGFPELDMVTCGWQPSTLIILAARTSVGKTAFSLSLAKNATKGTNPVSVGIFSLEMQDKELVDRVISQESDVWLWRFKNGRLDDGNMNKIYDASNRLKKSKIFIDDTSGLTIEEFKVKARLMKRKENVGLIIIDYLQLMKSPTKKIREQEIAHISGELKGMSKELNIPIIALSQMSRDIEKGEHRKPKLSDLRESGATEQDADIIMFLYRPSKAELDENAEMKQMFYLYGAKHRSGSLFDMIGKFTPENQKHHWLKIVDGNTNEPIKDIWTPVDLAPQKSFHDAEREEDPF